MRNRQICIISDSTRAKAVAQTLPADGRKQSDSPAPPPLSAQALCALPPSTSTLSLSLATKNFLQSTHFRFDMKGEREGPAWGAGQGEEMKTVLFTFDKHW